MVKPQTSPDRVQGRKASSRGNPAALFPAAAAHPYTGDVPPDLGVDLAPGHKTGLQLRNPVMPASGTFSWGLEFAKHFDINALGAVVSKGITTAPRQGNPQPRVAETPAGMLNSIGLQNVGLGEVIKSLAPTWAKWDVPVIANIAADTVEEFGEMAARLDGTPGIAALELNISCPNVDQGGIEIGQSVEASARATRAAVRHTDLPVIVKLTPNVTDPVALALACEAEGAAAICAINTVLGLAIDTRRRRPVLPRARGGLSGPAIKPIALRIVYDVAKAARIPVIGCGGIRTGQDAIEFLMAGATAVQVGTATFANPRALLDVIEGIGGWLEGEGVASVRDIIGCALPPRD
ncbi:MAG: dihydroorotate dehydrogenase [Chloroflexi bacterium CFX7]|nr:dihydroorotate dehydrogenase [Chloroflexi bacterium CFX7]RIL01942.1 MAG: dihydroorotate dehydrogenase [bacterium]